MFAPLEQMDLNAWVKLKYGRRIDPETERGVLSAEDAAIYRPLWIERLARAVRVPWQTITLRRPRQRWRARRDGDDLVDPLQRRHRTSMSTRHVLSAESGGEPDRKLIALRPRVVAFSDRLLLSSCTTIENRRSWLEEPSS